jgi:hydroxylamine reductase
LFCNQCEQTAKGTGCTAAGVCGKDHNTAALQDLLVYAVKGIAMYGHRNRELGVKDCEIDAFIIKALFSTVTNVNFDPERLRSLLVKAGELIEKAERNYIEATQKAGQKPEPLDGPAKWRPVNNLAQLITQGEAVGYQENIEKFGPDIAGLLNMVAFGIKGMAAYVEHARILGVEDDQVYAFFHQGMDFLAKTQFTMDELVTMALKVGEVNLRVMELLDGANTSTYGHPEPTKVRITPVKGKAILISGHDLKDLAELLEQTAGKGINIYTHGEMLPAHGYPNLKKHPHLVGNYGGAWQNQKEEFDKFPGAILMTTNCIQKPAESYQGRIFTTGLVAWPGVKHIENHNFGPVIETALKAPGFSDDEPEKYITVGFGRNAVLNAADKIVSAVKAGKIRHFFLIGGCDGVKAGRSYFTELAQKVPHDCIILTLACGKYRFNKLEFGTIEGIPRLLDVGQCNDAYSAIKIAEALANIFRTDVNHLPLSLILSWYEQKAVSILLSLLHLGIKNIRIGPSMPAFITPSVYETLKQNFNLLPITNPDDDLQAILGEFALTK